MRVAFYTAVTGPGNGFIPDVSGLENPGFDFYLLKDTHHGNVPGWTSIDLDEAFPLDPGMHGHKQRYGKVMPQTFFPDHQYSVYLDPKWDFGTQFLQHCWTLVQQQHDWLTCEHPGRSTFQEELLFAFCNGILDLDECKRLLDVLAADGVRFERYFTSLCTWIIRRHDSRTRKTGERWFDLIYRCYEGNVRDQLLLPFATPYRNLVKRRLRIAQLYQHGGTLNYPNQARTRQVNWKPQVRELLSYLELKTGIRVQEQAIRHLESTPATSA